MAKTIQWNAGGKINLSIDVKGRRSDSYHQVSMVMHQIGLADLVEVELEETEGETHIQVITDHPDLPEGEGNIAYRAARRFLEIHGAGRSFDVTIQIQKHIPLAAGLAGGSADAAAVLHALNILLDKNLLLSEMMDIGVALGADVPFCLMGQGLSTCALAEGIGEELTPLPPFPAHVILCKPNIDVSTREIYQSLDMTKISRRPDTKDLLEGLKTHDGRMLKKSVWNVLEDVVQRLHPEVGDLRKDMEEIAGRYPQDAWIIQMSGSGPTMYLLTRIDSLAEEMYRHMSRKNLQVYWSQALANPMNYDFEKSKDVIR